MLYPHPLFFLLLSNLPYVFSSQSAGQRKAAALLRRSVQKRQPWMWSPVNQQLLNDQIDAEQKARHGSRSFRQDSNTPRHEWKNPMDAIKERDTHTKYEQDLIIGIHDPEHRPGKHGTEKHDPEVATERYDATRSLTPRASTRPF